MAVLLALSEDRQRAASRFAHLPLARSMKKGTGMSAFPPDFDPRNLPKAEAAAAPSKPEAEPKKSSWWFVFEQWVSVPTDEEEYVLA
jgi:hypothetical protein